MQANTVSDNGGTKLGSEPATKKPRTAPPVEVPKIPLREWLEKNRPDLDIGFGYPSLCAALFPDTPVEDAAIAVTSDTPRYFGTEDIGRQPSYAAEDARINEELQRLREAYMAADLALGTIIREMADYITLDKTGQFPYRRVLIEVQRGEELTQADRNAKRPAKRADGSTYLQAESDTTYALLFRAHDDGWLMVQLTSALYKKMMAEVAFAPSQQRPPIASSGDNIPTVPVDGRANASEKRVSLHPPHPFIKKLQVRRPECCTDNRLAQGRAAQLTVVHGALCATQWLPTLEPPSARLSTFNVASIGAHEHTTAFAGCGRCQEEASTGRARQASSH